ncbi:hypothetical protein [Povalibacter sp.]|uniref:hypothetical protein n=1 Tax=Povalibacter sp. TaxID=1962978 RepID=UPI002F3E3DB5
MNTVFRPRALIVAALLLASPVISQASEVQAMQACIKAFVSTSLEADRAYTVRTRDSVATSLDHQARLYRILLTAKGKHSGEQVAKATCVTDRSGVVLSFDGKPVRNDAILSAR